MLTEIGNYIIRNPLIALYWAFGLYLFWKLSIWGMRYSYAQVVSKTNLYMRITLPREDSTKDKEKATEKDFREKIGIMEQFFRNIHEIRELSLRNILRNWVFNSAVISFELVTENKMIDFYVVCVPYYQTLIEKQITSYYPNADIQLVEPYEIQPKGNKVKCYYAYLTKEFWYPLKTYKTIENDPLNDMTNIFSKLAMNEKAALQLVIRPKTAKWAKKAKEVATGIFQARKSSWISNIPVLGWIGSIFGFLLAGSGKAGDNQTKDYERGYVRMLQTTEEMAKKMGEKSTQVGFDAVIRIIASAETSERTEEIINNTSIALNLFKAADMNWFQTRRIIFIDALNNLIMMHNFRKRLLDARILFFGEKASILVPEELAGIYHFPHSVYNYTPNIRWLSYRVLPPPPDVPTDGILLGYNSYRGFKKEIHFLEKDRGRHFYIIGKSGSGKSVFLSYMARQDIQNGKGLAVIDPHGDLIEDLINYVPKERVKDVIIFNPADMERPMGLNILEAKTPEQQDLASSQATEIFIKLFGDEIFGPRIQHYFRNACLTLMEDQDEGATLIDVPRIFVDDAFMKYKVAKIKNPVVKSFWEHEYASTGEREKQEMIPYFSAKFGPFITNSIMRNTIGQTKSGFNFRQCMDEGKILLVNLSKGKIGDLNTQLLGLIIVARLQMAAMSRADMPEAERKDFYLYVDEFQNFATDSFCSILSEARKYRLGLIMAHQYISQLVVTKFGNSSTQIRDAVFGNVGSLCSFKVGAEDAEYLAKEYAPTLTEQDIIGVANYKAYMKLNINNTTSRPFSLETIYDTKGQNEKIGAIVKEYSRMKYGRKKEFVDQEISDRIGIEI